MCGEFQLANAAVAVHAIDNCTPKIEVDNESLRHGLSTARIPGRMEIIRTHSPLIIMDAAHNEMAARALGDAVKHEFQSDKRPVILVVGMSKGHEPLEFIKPLIQTLGVKKTELTFIATQPDFRPREVDELVETAITLGIDKIYEVSNVESAASLGLKLANDSGDESILIITGSFFTIGELNPVKWQKILSEHGKGEVIPKTLSSSYVEELSTK
jgi:dihydrofolate synthase/folylpolyglutamate synthase